MQRQSLVSFFLHSGLVSADAAVVFAEQFEPISLSKNDFFLKEGSISDQYLFLETGCMRAFAIDTKGNEITTNFFSKGTVVFEVSSFFNRTKSKENIQALTNCSGWNIDYATLNHLFHAMPEFREFGRSLLVSGFASLKNRMLSIITATAEERYEKLLQTNPSIFQTAALKHIASYLGVTDTSLSRIRKKFAKQ